MPMSKVGFQISPWLKKLANESLQEGHVQEGSELAFTSKGRCVGRRSRSVKEMKFLNWKSQDIKQ